MRLKSGEGAGGSGSAGSAAPTALAVDERVRLMRDGVINYLGMFCSGLVGIFMVPILLGGLGAELYGLWIAVLAVAGIVGVLDFGLGWSVMRAVAAALSGEDAEETARFVRAAGHAYLILGMLGAALIGTLSVPLSAGLHLSVEGQRLAPAVFGLVGLAFLGDQLLAFAMAVLHGLRRFDVATLASIAALLLRATGTVALLAAAHGLVAVAVWHAVTSMVSGFLALTVVGRLAPAYHVRAGRVDWRLLRARLPFGLTSMLTAATSAIIWDAPQLLIGVIRGSSSSPTTASSRSKTCTCCCSTW